MQRAREARKRPSNTRAASGRVVLLDLEPNGLQSFSALCFDFTIVQ